MKYYKLNIKDAYTTERYNGNIQAHFGKKKFKILSNVKQILDKEKKSKLDELNTYIDFKIKIEKAKNDLQNYLNKNSNLSIIGKAFPARASVILNYFSFLKDKKIHSRTTVTLKLNNYIAGTNIKIVDSKILKNKPDIIIIFAWHLFNEIRTRES